MNRTLVDWYGGRTASEVRPTVEALKRGFAGFGDSLELQPRARGYMGYAQSADLAIGGMRVGLMAYGGESQRDWVMVSLTGKGCSWVQDWDLLEGEMSQLDDFQLRRVDLALDTVDRSVGHDLVLEAYRAGEFNTGGRPPKCEQILPEDPTDGRTVYIGTRERGKFFRGYEKGWELAKDFPRGVKPVSIDGVPVADLYRCEVEYKAKDAVLPDDLVERRDQYFAGAYPFLQRVLEVEPEVFVQRRERGPQLDLSAALAQVRHQYGTTLFTALMAYHGDMTAVWDQIVKRRHNMTLVDAGVLLVEHE